MELEIIILIRLEEKKKGTERSRLTIELQKCINLWIAIAETLNRYFK